MNVIETPLRLFCELTLEGALSGNYTYEFQRQVTDADGNEVVRPQIMTRDMSAEEAVAVLQTGSAEKAAEIKALHAQIASMQEAAKVAEAQAKAVVDDLVAQLADENSRVVALNELVQKIKSANQQWDNQVLGALDKIP